MDQLAAAGMQKLWATSGMRGYGSKVEGTATEERGYYREAALGGKAGRQNETRKQCVDHCAHSTRPTLRKNNDLRLFPNLGKKKKKIKLRLGIETSGVMTTTKKELACRVYNISFYFICIQLLKYPIRDT